MNEWLVLWVAILCVVFGAIVVVLFDDDENECLHPRYVPLGTGDMTVVCDD